ncbi:esterase/lipase family protein [Agromyces italicus]|uniref:esterase/lipase family protein n=1 Tax=Agromyces italicus TaxID=279572 RepID=UPI0003B786C6|nr:alpha/beta fold hydrolase [Agromyces italicus]
MTEYTEISTVSKGLFVFIPGLPPRSLTTRAPWKTLVDRLRADLEPNWRVEVFEHELTATSREDLDDVVRRLAAQMRDWTGELSTDVEPPDGIIIAGHSFGGILARAAYLLDATAPDATNTDRDEHPWTGLLKRIVLLGSPNSGYRTDARKTPLRWRLAYALATPFFDFTFEKVMAGGYWITDLRLRWLEAFRSASDRPRVIQILGTSDPLVTHADVIDQKFMPRTKVYEIPNADHRGLIEVDAAPDPDRRYRQLKDAILGRPDETFDDELIRKSGPTAFILHGIRASALGTWVEDLGADFAAASGHADDEETLVINPDTGYFSALEFALPGTRRRKVHEFLRLYGEAYATRDPEQFVFAGHSNGTYMMAQSLDRVPAMRFKRIYLAGTVLPRRYEWQRVFENEQIGHRGEAGWQAGEVRIDRATRDVPVGILCSWLRGLGSADVGTAGVDGFENISGRAIDQHRRVPGGHGAALKSPEQLREIAGYLAQDSVAVDRASRRASSAPTTAAASSSSAPATATATAGMTPAAAPGAAPGAERSGPGWGERLFNGASRFVGLRPVAWILLLGLGALAATGLVKLGRAKGAKVAVGTGAAAGIGFWALLRSI